ncbi:juvenile hormone acid O-methyltransferase-like [Amblyomma americanum]
MKFHPECYVKYVHYPSQLNEEALKKTCFQKPLTKDQQVLEVGCGIGHFAQQFLLPHCQPCRRLVATDLQPDMVRFARERFPHEDIVYDVLDIATPNLSPFLEKYGKFDRVFSFLTFHMIQDQKTAYANVSKLLNEGGECLVLGFASHDIVDVCAELCQTDRWKGRVPDPRKAAHPTFNFNRVKSASQVEAEVRDTLRGTGLECLSCDVYDSGWKYDDMDSLLDMFLTTLPFRSTVPDEDWEDFRTVWAEMMFRKLSPSPGKPLEVKFSLYAVHARHA